MTRSNGEKVGPPATKYFGDSLRNSLDAVYSIFKLVFEKGARAEKQRRRGE